MRALAVVVVIAGSLFSQESLDQKQGRRSSLRTNMLELLEHAQEKIDAFAGAHDVQVLKDAEAALASIELHQEHDAPKRLALRRQMLETWLALATAIDRNIDPNFDPNDTPMESMVPPAVDGVSISSNAPENIKDPEARRRFQRAVDENTRKTIRYTMQFELQRLNEGVSEKLNHFVRLAYVPAPSDQREVEAALKKSGATPARAQPLLAIVKPRE